MANENVFQPELIKTIHDLFPGCYVLKLDHNYIQGFPDRLLLYENRWAAFEIKKFENAPRQPNQEYYVDELNKMSFASFVYPENEKEFLYELQRALRPGRSARILRRV